MEDWMYAQFEMLETRVPANAILFRTGGRIRGRGGKRGQNVDKSREKRLYFTQEFGDRKNITVPSHKVGRIIGKGGCKIRNLEYESEAKIKFGYSSRNETTITLFGSTEAILKVEGMINKLLEDRRPAPREHFNNSHTSGGSNDFLKKSQDGVEIIDWDKLNAVHTAKGEMGELTPNYKRLL